MNRLSIEEETAIVAALTEGASLSSAARIANCHRETVSKTMMRVGATCAEVLDRTMRGIKCEAIELDELWTFVQKKQRRIRATDDPTQVGDFFVYTSIDPASKVMPSHLVAKRNRAATQEFIRDLASRLLNKVLISADGFSPYVESIDEEFGPNCDFAQVIKSYQAEPIGPGRYAPPRVSSLEKIAVLGEPDLKKAGTSRVEASNRTIRMRCRRFTRLCDAFSKKVEPLKAAVALFFGDYNLVRRHQTTGEVPAVAAGLIASPMSLRDLVEMSRECPN